jgi:hypothetical protein
VAEGEEGPGRVSDGDGEKHQDRRSVTLALIDAKIDVVIEKVAEVRECQKEHEKRIEALEQDNARAKERLGLVGLLTLISSAIAAWIGSRN